MEIFIGPKHRVRRIVSGAADPPPAATDILLCNTDLPNKAINQLDAIEIFTLGELAEKDSHFILALPNMGETTLWLLKQLLDSYDIPNTFGELFSIENGRRVFRRPRTAADSKKPTRHNLRPGSVDFSELDLFI
jgi:hypothetical protein